ncbi:hypothetical protein WDW86_21605, partial [Bdellovibrionota bacterium FG-2]
TMSDLKDAFMNFRIVDENPEAVNAKATLFGMIFDDCKGLFVIENTSINKGIATDNSAPNGASIGFSIRDEDGKGRACMKKHRATGDVCGKTAPLTCSRLSLAYEGAATFDMSAQGDGTPRLCHQDPNNDLTPLVCEDFSPALPKHLSAKTMLENRKRLAKQKRDAKIASLTSLVKSCRANLDEIGTARASRDELLGMSAINDDVLKQLNKELDAAEKALIAAKNSADLASLTSRVKKASFGDLDALREDLAAYGAANADSGEKLAPLYRELALKYINPKNPEGPSYEAASATLFEAGSLSGLKPQTQLRLDNYQLDLSVGKVQSMAQYGISNNNLFYPSYYSLMMDLQNKSMTSCSGPYASQEACASLQTAAQAASQIPVQATQVEQQRQQTQMRIQQLMGAGGVNMPMSYSGGMAGPSAGMGAGLGFMPRI